MAEKTQAQPAYHPPAQPQGTPVGTADLLSLIGELTVENRVLRGTVQELSGRLASAMKELDGLKINDPGKAHKQAKDGK